MSDDVGETVARCPACQAVLPKVPQRKTKCKACGQFMYVRSTPDNRTRRLMTEQQMQASEAAWSAVQQAAESQRELEVFGIPAADFTQPAGVADLDAALAQAEVLARGGPQIKMAVIGLYRAAPTPTEALAAHLALMLLEQQSVRRIAYTAEVRCGMYDQRQHCGPCERLRHMVISTDAPVEAWAPMDCPKLREPVGRRRGSCNVALSAWVTQPDGSMKIDRRPTPPRDGPPRTPAELEQARGAIGALLGVELPKAGEPMAPAAAPAAAEAQGQQQAPGRQDAPVSWWRRLLGLG